MVGRHDLLPIDVGNISIPSGNSGASHPVWGAQLHVFHDNYVLIDEQQKEDGEIPLWMRVDCKIARDQVTFSFSSSFSVLFCS